MVARDHPVARDHLARRTVPLDPHSVPHPRDHAARLDAVAKAAIESKCSANVPQNEEGNQKSPSRLGDLNPGPTHYECVDQPPELEEDTERPSY